jgi:hypothetical protein
MFEFHASFRAGGGRRSSVTRACMATPERVLRIVRHKNYVYFIAMLRRIFIATFTVLWLGVGTVS